jgi:RNA polymerase sigma-70 factor (ECF subfamily)
MYTRLSYKSQYPDRSALIGKAYTEYYAAVFNYLRQRVGNSPGAEDLTQDVFVRLLEYGGELRECTLKYFVFTVARSILYDYLRRLYRRRHILADTTVETAEASNEVESRIIAQEFAEMERREINHLSPQRKIVYALYRFSEQGASDIAHDLALSRRTVENHIFPARQTIQKVMERYCS